MYDRNSISNKKVKIAAGIQLQKAFDESRFKLALKYALGHSIKMLEANALSHCSSSGGNINFCCSPQNEAI